ncbi:hypothetical protein Desgi_1495 [Desulfoscipio gibsoniae DSM 7213]|uniref:Uncharacterized protein n=1 Tax=Desulfoscipio gibsoniae DSM 7213 TaxID=767817 RepID=R4KMW7_9FIRM|nr:hypothetical protein Desgi_1495 [Desulfoscipio gibsoniae DSM 7213]
MGKLHHLNVGCADASLIKTSYQTFLIDCYNVSLLEYRISLPPRYFKFISFRG